MGRGEAEKGGRREGGEGPKQISTNVPPDKNLSNLAIHAVSLTQDSHVSSETGGHLQKGLD